MGGVTPAMPVDFCRPVVPKARFSGSTCSAGTSSWNAGRAQAANLLSDGERVAQLTDFGLVFQDDWADNGT